MITYHMEMYGFPHAAGPELDRLAAGPGSETVMRMETALAEGTSITEARAHVITGYLKASVSSDSSFAIDIWTGTIKAARHPGIFELARGDSPTFNHPEGGHYFFDPGGPQFEHDVREAVWDWITGGTLDRAPIEGLGPWSGGY